MIHVRPAVTLATVLATALAGAALLSGPVHAAPQGKKLYCWEEEGRKICGDALPADAADNARTEFNAKTGMQVGEVARALTAEERVALEAEKARAAEEAKAEAARQRRELAMVESYATEDELRRAFRNRTALMDDTVQASRLAIANLREGLLTRLRQASELELAGKPVGEELAAEIARQHEMLEQRRGILAVNQEERAMLDAELASAVARYRELTGPADAGSAEPADADADADTEADTAAATSEP